VERRILVALAVVLSLPGVVSARAWSAPSTCLRPVADESSEEGDLSVAVVETPRTVRLRIHLPGTIDTGSIEVMLAGRDVTVRAQDLDGRPIRSQTLRLRRPAVEDGARADYAADGWLTITLRRARAEGRR